MSLEIACSSAADNSMRALSSDQRVAVATNRQAFLTSHNIAMANTTLVHLAYQGDDFCRYQALRDSDKGDGMVSQSTLVLDGAVVTTPGHALFLPLADCVGAIIHDPTKGILMLSHLGRHNLEQFGGTKSIEYLIKEHGVNPRDITVWLSPAASKEHYPLFAFNNRGLHEVATEQLIQAGVQPQNITISPIDSAADQNYYSHSQFLKGNRHDDGRFAVVAMMR